MCGLLPTIRIPTTHNSSVNTSLVSSSAETFKSRISDGCMIPASSSNVCAPCTVQAVALVWIKRASRSAWIVDVAGGVYAVLYILGFIMLCALLHDGTVSLWFLWGIGTFPVATQGQLGRWCCSNLSAHRRGAPSPSPSLLQSLLSPKLLCLACPLSLCDTTCIFCSPQSL
jgi:hypothetical protein